MLQETKYYVQQQKRVFFESAHTMPFVQLLTPDVMSFQNALLVTDHIEKAFLSRRRRRRCLTIFCSKLIAFLTIALSFHNNVSTLDLETPWWTHLARTSLEATFRLTDERVEYCLRVATIIAHRIGLRACFVAVFPRVEIVGDGVGGYKCQE
jgi:hypothetical protein